MKTSIDAGKRIAAKLTAAVLCACMLPGLSGTNAFAIEAKEAALEKDPYRLVDLYCSQSAIGN